MVVYDTTEQQLAALKQLSANGVRQIVFVGKPYSKHPQGITYRSSVKEILQTVTSSDDIDIQPGVIGMHVRPDEADIIANKFIAAGKQMFIMGQFLDSVEPMLQFLDQLERCFEEED